jgi:hypothetical protein
MDNVTSDGETATTTSSAANITVDDPAASTVTG